MTKRSRLPYEATLKVLKDAIINAYPLVALDLPLKLLVWEEHGVVNLAYSPMSEIAARYGITGMNARIETIDHAIDSLIHTVA